MSNDYDHDRSLPEDREISDAHPMRTGRHDLYQQAMRLVGAKHSKQALVLLVNWLLYRLAERGASEKKRSYERRDEEERSR